MRSERSRIDALTSRVSAAAKRARLDALRGSASWRQPCISVSLRAARAVCARPEHAGCPRSPAQACVAAHGTVVLWNSWTGFVSGSVISLFLNPACGRLSDCYGRKNLIVVRERRSKPRSRAASLPRAAPSPRSFPSCAAAAPRQPSP